MSSGVLVGDVMTRNVKTVRPDTKLREILQKMSKFNISSVIVMERNRPAGIITSSDIINNLSKSILDLDLLEAKNMMSRSLITIDEDVDIEEASHLMLRNALKKLLVVREKELVGIVTSSDMIRKSKLTKLPAKELLSIGKDFE